jgi:hypothetical protein
MLYAKKTQLTIEIIVKKNAYLGFAAWKSPNPIVSIIVVPK